MNKQRGFLIKEGLDELPFLKEYLFGGSNGESLAFDEAGVWKRVLNYRIAKHYQPLKILETHKGIGLGTDLYRRASPFSEIVSLEDFTKCPTDKFDLVDIDPSAAPWDALSYIECHDELILMISNGEAMAVARGFKKGVKYPTAYKGKELPKWVIYDYLPLLQDVTGMQVKFFYCFPTTIRVILSNKEMPESLFNGCPNWMYWLPKYASKL